MHLLKPVAVACAALLLTSGCLAVRAADRAEHRQAALDKLHDKFAAADTDHDGFLTRAEAQSGMPNIAAHFDEVDSDHDGKLSLAEVGAYFAKMRADRGK